MRHCAAAPPAVFACRPGSVRGSMSRPVIGTSPARLTVTPSSPIKRSQGRPTPSRTTSDRPALPRPRDRALRASGHPITLATLVDALEPRRLEITARGIDDERQAQRPQDYLDSLTPEQVRGLAGTRERLAILAESDVAEWLQPHDAGGVALDLLRSVEAGEVVSFRLDPARRPSWPRCSPPRSYKTPSPSPPTNNTTRARRSC
jgi:hypothetical protein